MIEIIKIETKGDTDIINISDKVQKTVDKSKNKEGIVNVFTRHTTAGIAIMENEKGILMDFKEILERIAPVYSKYHHNEMQSDNNGSLHFKASLIGSSVSVPFREGKLLLGTWQQIFLVDFDTHAREREIVVNVIEG